VRAVPEAPARSPGQPDAGSRRPASLAYQPALDGLRAWAVLAVIAYHMGYKWAPGGFLGVDLFFVLSGFLITSLLLVEWEGSGRVTLRRFWSRRARRLLPAVWLLLVAASIYVWIDLPAWELVRFRGDALASLFYVVNWRFVFTGQSYFDIVTGPSVLRHLWSLAVEEQFYVVWPLVVFACLRLGRGSRRILAWATGLGVVASAVWMWVVFDPDSPSRAYYGTDSRAHTLLVGALLALALRRRAPREGGERRLVHGLGAVGVVVVLAAWWRLEDSSGFFYRGGSLLYAVAVAAVIASAVQPAGALRRGLSPAPLRWLGRISYGVYLWHWPVIVVLSAERTGIRSFAVLNLLRLGATFAFSIASYYLVERPIRLGALRMPAMRAVAPAAFTVTAVVAVVATLGAGPSPSALLLKERLRSPWPCDRSSSLFRRLAEGNLRKFGGPPRLSGDARPRVLVIGDSLACSLSVGLREVGEAVDAPVRNAAVMGCGVVSGEVVPVNGLPPRAWSRQCPDLVARVLDSALSSFDPEVVVWYSTWEIESRYVDGEISTVGTPSDDALLRERIGALYRRLVARGARLVFLAASSPAPAPERRVVPPAPEKLAALDHVNDLYRSFAADHPYATVIDSSEILCRGGRPCPRRVGRVEPRRGDGVHFSVEGSVWFARWLMPQLVELVSTPVPSAPPATTAGP